MSEVLWRVVARIASRPAVANWLIRRAKRTPYRHITGPDGSLYMGRWWLFNPYPHDSAPQAEREAWAKSWRAKLPSIRIHHIMRPDSDRHLHDHPWDARTMILDGWYVEERPSVKGAGSVLVNAKWRSVHERTRGYTGTLLFGQFHRIEEVCPGGVFTLFITWRKRGTWGFLVDGRKVPWREYLGEEA